MMKKVIYTCLVGNYDNLLQPLAVDENFDYICFSNDIKESNVGLWQIRKIPYECKNSRQLSRYVKILPHIALPDYEYSVWIDANLQITTKEFYCEVNNKISANEIISQVPHVIPPCNCVYNDIMNCYVQYKVSFVEAIRQLRHLIINGYPMNYGLFENNVILRKHLHPLVCRVDEEWWKEFITYAHRDQFSLCYVYWKFNIWPCLLFGELQCSRNVDCLVYYLHTNEMNFTKRVVRFYRRKIGERIRKMVCFVLFQKLILKRQWIVKF